MSKATHKARIEICCRLHEGIRGGGKVTVEQTFGVGPRNIVRAHYALLEEHREAERCYGNVGCGSTFAVLVDERGEIGISGALSDLVAMYDAWRHATRNERLMHGLNKPKMPRTAAELRAVAEGREAMDRETARRGRDRPSHPKTDQRV